MVNKCLLSHDFIYTTTMKRKVIITQNIEDKEQIRETTVDITKNNEINIIKT